MGDVGPSTSVHESREISMYSLRTRGNADFSSITLLNLSHSFINISSIFKHLNNRRYHCAEHATGAMAAIYDLTGSMAYKRHQIHLEASRLRLELWELQAMTKRLLSSS